MTFCLESTIIKPEKNNNINNVVVLFHGYGGDGKDISMLTLNWKRHMPNTIFICPNGHETCSINPSGYQSEVIGHNHHFDLTLSGHTHGFQYGIEVAGLQWSPSKFRYPQWAGMYEKNQRLINVNRGFGFLGYPGRFGIWPEITVITLKSA